MSELYPVVLQLDAALIAWENAKKELEVAKETEMTCRKAAFELGFGEDAKEGTNTVPLANGYSLKGVKKYNYKLTAPQNFSGDTIDAVDQVIDRMTQLSNEGAFIAERIFKFSVDLSLTEYRKLVEEAEYMAVKKMLLDQVNTVLVITEATPTLEIKEPKAKR